MCVYVYEKHDFTTKRHEYNTSCEYKPLQLIPSVLGGGGVNSSDFPLQRIFDCDLVEIPSSTGSP